MTRVRKHIDSFPLISPSLSDFNIDVNVCRNPACANFGLSAQDITDQRYGYKYSVDKENNPSLTCKRCNQKGKVYSNQGMLEAFHICLANSIPYATCPNTDCDNHKINLFEYFSTTSKKGQKPYTINRADDKAKYYQARCCQCQASFPISESMRIYTKQTKNWIETMDRFINSIVNQLGASKIMNTMKWNAEKYYSWLNASSSLLGRYNNFHVSEIAKQRYFHDELSVYTDCLLVSLKVHRKNQRVQIMKVIFSVISCKNRYLILAWHPLFQETIIDDDVLIDDSNLPIEQQRYAYLKHPFQLKKEKYLPLLGINGYFMDDQYAYMAHFLVVRKLLKNVKKLTLYMDAEKALCSSALMAFSDRIKEKTCDVVSLKMDKVRKNSKSMRMSPRYIKALNDAKKNYKQSFPEQKKAASIPELKRFLLAPQVETVNKAIKKSAQGQKILFSESLAMVYRKAVNHPNKQGKAFWVTDMLSSKDQPGLKMLWLTRDKDKMNTQYELDLYSNGTIFPVDSVFNMIRSRAAMASRPNLTATGQRGFNSNAELPLSVIKELSVNVAFINFFLQYRQKAKVSVAYIHQLVKHPSPPNINKIIKFKPSFKDAARITKWLGS